METVVRVGEGLAAVDVVPGDGAEHILLPSRDRGRLLRSAGQTNRGEVMLFLTLGASFPKSLAECSPVL